MRYKVIITKCNVDIAFSYHERYIKQFRNVSFIVQMIEHLNKALWYITTERALYNAIIVIIKYIIHYKLRIQH